MSAQKTIRNADQAHSGAPAVSAHHLDHHADGLTPVMAVRPPALDDPQTRARRASISPEDWDRYQTYMAEIFSAMGLRLDTPGTMDTPRRFVQALFDSTEGYEGDPNLETVFPTECYGGASCELSQVVEGPIPFMSLCEHHALPFFGMAYIGYVAHENIIGISKLTRLVRLATRRFGVQERMTHQIAEGLVGLTEPHGVAVYMEAHHLCTQMRGVRELHPMTRTTAFRGVYETNSALRAEFYHLAGLERRVAG